MAKDAQGNKIPLSFNWADIVGNVVNLIPTIIQGGIGRRQLRQADQIERENPLPEASISPAIQRMSDYAYGQTFASDIPGGGIARDQIMQATASGVKAATERGQGAEAFGFLRDVTMGSQNQFADIARQTAEYVSGRQQDYLNTLPYLAQEQERVWNWNEAQPYMRAMDTARMLRESGTKNLFGGASNLAGSVSKGITSLWGSRNTGKASDITLEQIIKAFQK